MSRVMSDAEIRRRKKAQGAISRATGALGLASLGAFGAARGAKSAKATKLIPGLKRVDSKKADTVALGTSAAGAGIGGAGSFNFAAYTSAESRKRNPRQPVKKSQGVSAFGVSHD